MVRHVCSHGAQDQVTKLLRTTHSQARRAARTLWRRSGEAAQVWCEGAECPAPVADGVLLGRGHLRRRAGVAVGDEDRVVSEAALPAWLADHVTGDASLLHDLTSVGCDQRRRADKGCPSVA